jgi:hypothetical protein
VGTCRLELVRRGLVSSERSDFVSLQTFLALAYGKLDFLAFLEGFETGAFDGLEVGEYVRAVILRNETETLGFVEPFNGSCSSAHVFTFLQLRFYMLDECPAWAVGYALNLWKRSEYLEGNIEAVYTVT